MAIKLFLLVAVLTVAATQAANPRFRAVSGTDKKAGWHKPCEYKLIGTNCEEKMKCKDLNQNSLTAPMNFICIMSSEEAEGKRITDTAKEACKGVHEELLRAPSKGQFKISVEMCISLAKPHLRKESNLKEHFAEKWVACVKSAMTVGRGYDEARLC